MHRKLNILLVDDNEFDLFLNEKFLQLKDVAQSIQKFSEANKALDYLNNTDINEMPDLILLDIHMPIMDGFDFISAYKNLPEQKLQKIKVVMVSSSIDKDDTARAEAEPHVLDLLTKPLNVDLLMELFEKS